MEQKQIEFESKVIKTEYKIIIPAETTDLKLIVDSDLIDDTIKIIKTKKGFRVGGAIPDLNTENPLDTDEFLGKLYHWKTNDKEVYNKYCELLGYDTETKEKVKEQYKYAISIDKYEHGSITYSISGEGYKCRWDTSYGWAVWIPCDKDIKHLDKMRNIEKRQKELYKICREALKIFNCYLHGEVYGYLIYEFSKRGKKLKTDSCFGFYGADVITAEIDRLMQSGL